MIRPKNVPPRGILHRRSDDAMTGYARYWPDESLAPWVEHFWTVAWDYAEPRTSEVLTHPSVQMVLERGASRIAGVHRARFVRCLEGKGRVLGTKFRPGGFRGFFGRPVSELTDRMVPLRDVFGAAADDLEAQALAHADAVAAFAVVQGFLAARRPPPDAIAALAARIAERIAADREITRVDQVAAAFDLGVRRLQRLCEDYVGVHPKWMIQRYRLHEAAERIAAGAASDWATLALDLGYADQAHFIRDFRKLVGWSPAEYARTLAERPPLR